MKLTSLLLSSAAVLVAGSAFAADLPAKKAAPAAAVVACPAFGAGFFQLPGSDTCIQFSGYMRAQMGFQSASDQANAVSTTALDRAYNAYSNTASWRLNVDVRSNTEIGVVRGYGRTSGAAVGEAYVQAGGFTAGLAGTWMGNGGGLIANDFGSHSGATQLSYSAALGGSTLKLSVVNSNVNVVNSATSAPVAPDMMVTISVPLGGATLGLGAVSHVTSGTTSGSENGYAVGATLGFAPAAGISMGIEGGYADGALGYLGTATQAASIDSTIEDIYDTDSPTAVTDSNTGYVVSAYMSAAAGPGSIGLLGSYTVLSDSNSDTTGTAVELNYAWTVAKNLTVTPAIAYLTADDGTDTANTTKAVIRIQRDF